jgi:iron complex transport system ATP-binding protein
MEVTNLSYSTGNRRLVDGLSFCVLAGQFLAVVGPNGAGKSTLLRLLTNELKPTVGAVILNGKALHNYSHPELARKRAVLTQHNKLSLPFEVAEVVMMGRYPFHKNTPDTKDYDIVEACLRKVDMLPFVHRSFTTLSGGEQQRVLLAKALAQIWEQKGGVLFLDEPTNGMDLKHQFLALELARELTYGGVTVIAVLHDLNMALQYANQVLLMQGGKMHGFGQPKEVLTPENIAQVFGVAVNLMQLPHSNTPVIVPSPGQFADSIVAPST